MTTAIKIPKLVLDPELPRDVIESVNAILHSSFALTVEALPHDVCTGYTSHGDLSGIIGMIEKENKYEGTLIVSFPKETIFSMLEVIYKKKFHEVNDSVRDGVAEITNVIFSIIKRNLNQRNYNFIWAIPNVVIAPNHQVFHSYDGHSLVIPFNCDSGKFEVCITVKSKTS